jgi:FMN-dependent NADH-azoreductase
MKTLLKITAGMAGASGHSAQLAEQFAKEWLAQNPGARLVRRDLSAEPVPHLTTERFQAFSTPAENRTVQQQAIVSYSDALITELKTADVVVFAVPMYNFSVPSTLRAYFDHIARAGVTFRYSADGPEGLIKGKETIVFIARGGVYPQEADTQTAYLRQFLSFVGLTPTRFVYAEGTALGDEMREQSLAKARTQIASLLAIPQAV